MRNKFLCYLISIIVVLFCVSSAHAQIGPNLRPPGLSEDQPIDSISKDGSDRGAEWLYMDSFELNASDVVFSASKKRQLISEAPSTIHVITDKQIASFGWRSLAEVLRHIPGVQTMMGDSQFQSVMIRGLVGTETNNSRILWLQNGVPFNDVRDSGVWIDETFPIELIKRIEVVLGPGSALYGSGAFQGVINIFTKDPSDLPEYGEYRIAMGNDMTFKASAMGGYVNEDKTAGFMIHASGNYTNGPGLIGDYVYETKLMTEAGISVGDSASPTAAHTTMQSIDPNSDKAWYNVTLKAFYKKLKFSLSFQDIYAGYDGSELLPNVGYNNDQLKPEERLDVNNYRFGRREFATEMFYEDNYLDNLSFLAVLSYRFNQYNHSNYAGLSYDGGKLLRVNYNGKLEMLEANLNDSNPTDGGDKIYVSEKYPLGISDKINFNTDQHKLYALAQLQWRIYENNELISGLVFEYDGIFAPEFVHDNTKTEEISEGRTNLNYVTPSFFLQDEQRLWDNRIILTAGARIDWYKANEEYIDKDTNETSLGHPAPSWRAAALFKWADWVTMRLSYGYSYKEPSLYQLHGDQVDYTGNPDLEAETLHNVELSFLFNPLHSLSIRLDGYATFMDNLITTEVFYSKDREMIGFPNIYSPQQYSGARIFGFELSANAKITDSWNLYTYYNFVHSRRVFGDDVEFTEGKSINHDLVPGDSPHRFALGAIYMNDFINADLSFVLVSGMPEINLEFTRDVKTYTSHFDAFDLYAGIQPHISFKLPANFGLMLQGGVVFSKGILESPTRRFYYEKANVPVNRYSGLVSVYYPFQK